MTRGNPISLGYELLSAFEKEVLLLDKEQMKPVTAVGSMYAADVLSQFDCFLYDVEQMLGKVCWSVVILTPQL